MEGKIFELGKKMNEDGTLENNIPMRQERW
jgi:hypothetical protein